MELFTAVGYIPAKNLKIQSALNIFGQHVMPTVFQTNVGKNINGPCCFFRDINQFVSKTEKLNVFEAILVCIRNLSHTSVIV